jgi:hypothetical protein
MIVISKHSPRFSFQMSIGWEHGERRHNIANNICDLDNKQGPSPT